MITYAMQIIEGDINQSHMTIQIGTTVINLFTPPIKCFIKAANECELNEVLSVLPSVEHELLSLLYEEFKNEI